MSKAEHHISILRRLTFLFALLLATAFHAVAQERISWEEFMQEMTEEYAFGEGEQWQELLELLNELHEHPININTAESEDLLQLPFLSEKAVDAIADYKALYGPMRSLGELILIVALGEREREWLKLFVFAAPVPAQLTTNQWKGAKQELSTRFDIPCYQRDGWPWAQGIAHQLRYFWQQGRRLDASLRLEKDAGEELFTHRSPFWDSYGGHVMLKNIGIIKQLLVGDFKAGFGEGLVINNSLQFGKASTSLWRTPEGIRPHRSTDEVHFMRGVAATLSLGQQWQLTAFYSIRALDATVNKDNSVSSISTTGLHRTDSEWSHRHTLQSQTTALHAQWQHNGWHAGVTGMFQYYDHQFLQNTTLYRHIYPEGYLFGAVSADYGYQRGRLLLRGETAHSFDSRGGGWATLNKAAWRFDANTQLAAIQRYYSKNYYSPHASAIGENSQVQNESGLTLQLDASRLGPFTLQALFDIFYSPWPRYTMTRYSWGWEGITQATWQPRQHYQLRLRYRVKSKETSDRRHYSHQLRATYVHDINQHWHAALSAFLHRYHEPDAARTAEMQSSSNGFALAPQISYTDASERLRAALMFVWFPTADYNSRLYLYEPSLFQTFGMAQLYGKGQRLAATLRLRTPNKRCEVQTKVGVTHYADRSEISSGVLRINASWKPDVQLLLRLKW